MALYLCRIRQAGQPDTYKWEEFSGILHKYGEELASPLAHGDRVEIYDKKLRGVASFTKWDGIVRIANLRHCRLHPKAAPPIPEGL